MSAQVISEKNKTGILLQCPNPTCNGRIWRYRGSMKTYCICPDCRRSVRIDKNKVSEMTQNKGVKSLYIIFRSDHDEILQWERQITAWYDNLSTE
ncbi:MAG: hypothetical protein GEU26_12845 [Nitrososphaeraceae archaeon]|nr:hypothetical protein [Nitrososphaeraceae archaeon]